MQSRNSQKQPRRSLSRGVQEFLGMPLREILRMPLLTTTLPEETKVARYSYMRPALHQSVLAAASITRKDNHSPFRQQAKSQTLAYSLAVSPGRSKHHSNRLLLLTVPVSRKSHGQRLIHS